MDRNWELLSSIAPVFLKLATFYIGENKEAIKARAELDLQAGRKEPFFAALWVELNELVDFTQTLETSVELPDQPVVRVLDVFENRCNVLRGGGIVGTLQHLFTPKQDIKYARLKMIERQSRTLSEKQLSLEHLMSMISLLELSGRKRKQILRRLSSCNEALGSLTRTAAHLKYSSSGLSVEPPSKAPRIYSQRRRNISNSVHNLLSSHWVCGESATQVDARLLLSSYHKPVTGLEDHFDVWFTVSSDPEAEISWQESDIWVVDKDEFLPLQTLGPVAELELEASSVEISKDLLAHSIRTKSIRFNISRRSELVEDISRGGLQEITEQDLFDLIQEGARHARRHLIILVQEEKLYWTSNLPRNDSKLQEFISLHQILEDGLLKQDMEKRLLKRCILAYLLASSFLQICDGRWSPGAWTCDLVSFFHSGDASLDISRPYLSTKFEKSKAESKEAAEFKHRLHPYPHILALGLILLQIYLASPIEDFRLPGHPNNDRKNKYDIDRDLGTALKMLDKCEGNSMKAYNNAIKACLTPQLPINSSPNEEEFRNQVYATIVFPLALTLRDGYGIDVEEDDWLTRVFSDGPRLQVPEFDKSKRSLVSEKNINGAFLQPEIGGYSPSSSQKNAQINADQWFEELIKFTHPLLNRTYLEKQAPPFNKIINRRGNVKIAILDTGIDFPISALEMYEDQLHGWKDWVMDGREDGPYVDKDGHGTHCAALILKIAPTADLYIARVFEKENDREIVPPSELLNERIANAIRHAVDIWKVDIISLSFGFEYGIDVIEAALDYANIKDTIILAAAGNRGGLSHPAWPARSKKAIGIHASDGFGNKGPFTANPTDGPYNFSLPGVNVLSFWPKSLGPDVRVRKSGTSCATAIAAGLAGVVLDFAGLYLSRRQNVEQFENRWPKLRSSDGIRVAFRLMAGGRDGYADLQPSTYLGSRGPGIETVMGNILYGLRYEI